ncbi:mitochondrial substrate carrier family protein B [Eucalyptus grandis]|uniref:mitochondrial substrate carrier family protein B n=1 Tax=Eucalyptus grandis TaxID=71139 RepID=UPI00192EA806|nr:mitochondrial substrate carrier family protein B [Eucalyptus grandis]
MSVEARVGVVMEGGQRALGSAHGGVLDGGPRSFFQQQQPSPPPPPPPPPPQQQLKKPSLNPQSQIGTVQQLLAGGVAGAFSKTCTAPLARLTILFQVQGMHTDVAALSKPSIWQEASRIANEEGFRAFWKGNMVTIAHRLPYSSVNFYAYERYKSMLQSILGENSKGSASAGLCVHFIGGGMAGITAASATYPLDLVRTRLAAQTNTVYYRGIWHAFNTICREEGFLGLYRGLGATLLGVGPSIAISFSVYESLRSFWQYQRPNDATVMVSLACGSLSGIASSTATFPLDLVRRRMQLEGAGGRARIYNCGLFGMFGHIMRTEGFCGLYRGILPEYYKVVPSVGIVFMTYETLKMLLSRISTPD